MTEDPTDTEEDGALNLWAGPKPRNGMGAEDPGSYAIVARTTSHEFAPGDEVGLELYITGYGAINAAKIMFSFPPDLTNPDKSFFNVDLHQTDAGSYVFGGRKLPLRNGVTLDLSQAGMQTDGWAESSLFFDFVREDPAGAGAPQILTETSQGRAPISIEFATKRKAKPGDYPLQAHLTYHNGFSWEQSSAVAQIRITSWWARNQPLTWFVGTVLALVALVVPIVIDLTVDQTIELREIPAPSSRTDPQP